MGRYEPNSLGLHDVIGNVFEWCADDHIAYDQAAGNGDLPGRDAGAKLVVFRGGCFHFPSVHARSAMRGFEARERRMFQTGVRPAARARLAR